MKISTKVLLGIRNVSYNYNNGYKIQNGHQNSKWRPFFGKCILIQNTNNLRCCNKVIIECFVYSEK